MQVDFVYTDFSKTFDKIDHCILIHKLAKTSVHGTLLKCLRQNPSSNYKWF